MNYGISLLSQIPLRAEPSHRSEMVSQLLFGETYHISQSTESWLKITCLHDAYEGWIDQNQHTTLAEKEHANLLNAPIGLALDPVSSATSPHRSIPIVTGSNLPYFDGISFKIGKEKFIYNGQAILDEARNAGLIERVALRYLNAPYLWGGRSPLGIDCSGFTQVVFKFCGISLKRDAYQQAEQGSLVNFIQEIQPGDLAFFANEEGKVTHTGIALKDQTIIHSSGKVRIDRLDHFGIFNAETQKYTHQLKVIKRLF